MKVRTLLICSCETPLVELCSTLGLLEQVGRGAAGEDPGEAMTMLKGLEHFYEKS